MKFSYKFSNLLGAVYKKGNLIFTPDGNSVISPVGNRITVFDLKNNKSTTLPVESKFDYNALDVSPNGCSLIAINEEGEAHMISLISQTIVHKYRFKRKCRAIKFSPDGKLFAVCKESNVFVFRAPGPFSGQYNAFVMERVFHGAFDETTCLDWSFDSRILAVGAKDMAVKLYPLDKWQNFRVFSLGSHTDSIVGCFFEAKTYDMTTVSRNGQACVWECTVNPEDLVPLSREPDAKKVKKSDMEEDEIDTSKSVEQTEELEKSMSKITIESSKLYYKRVARHYLCDEPKKDDEKVKLTSVAYHKLTKILIAGFSNGSFYIYELPDFNLVHSLSISNEKITAISLNATGDWICLGCGGLGQLLVWEWQSETYIMKQQGHSSNMCCLTHSSDGQLLATGGHDGKIKLWTIQTGFCFVTFSEHTNPVTDLAFGAAKKILVSASLDGTVRCFDLVRYRNFRTFTSANSRPVQFVCVTVDTSGEFVAAGGQDSFDIHLWSLKTGRLLEILGGHEGPVAAVKFSPQLASTLMVSVSWDKTLRIWDAVEKGAVHETVELVSDGLSVAFNPNGREVAVATLSGQVAVFDAKTATQLSSIDGRNDLGSGRADTDLVTAKKSLEAKAFTSLCYSADGQCLLAGGQSKNICIYNITDGIILKKFEVTQNRSLDAIDDFVNRRRMTEFGNLNLVEERGDVGLKLPGTRTGDCSSRSTKPEVRVFGLEFSPTGQQWAAATTEGLLVYSLSPGLVFDPWDLQLGITPASVREAIREEDHVNAIQMAIKLNEANLIQEVLESVPVKDVDLVVSCLGQQFIERLLMVVASALDTSRHLEYYLMWANSILVTWGPKVDPGRNLPNLLALEKSLLRKYEQISKMCDFNKFTMRYVLNLANSKKVEKIEETEIDEVEFSDS